MERDSSTLMNALQERLIGELKSYAGGRKASVLRNAETEALAGLLLEKFGYGWRLQHESPRSFSICPLLT